MADNRLSNMLLDDSNSDDESEIITRLWFWRESTANPTKIGYLAMPPSMELLKIPLHLIDTSFGVHWYFIVTLRYRSP
ncbi:hypothetical protein QJS10_CPA06g00384 [Acorus calamus]|uniref:Uncharacterized protein n=1 Tax=Acorus calamus TaxID=4465 RepID=A0AAV9EM37_ACOCL|nr:hypothetical protein QJS10_CPA06g00384 [Acorus calamus]